MTAAIFGLVGVVVGAAVTGWISYLLEARRERKAAQVAARLLLDDFLMADVRADGISEQDVWLRNPTAVFRFSTETWMEQRQILAATISAREYFDLADAAHGIKVGAAMVNAAVPAEPITDKEKTTLAMMRGSLTTALDVLRRHAGK